MRRVWKFPVAPYQQVQVLEVQGSDPVPVALAEDARGMLCMWVELDTAGKASDLHYAVVGTGWALPWGGQHVDTAVTEGGFVWHLYREKKQGG